MEKLRKVPGVFIDSQGRALRIYKKEPEIAPFYERHPGWTLLGIIVYILSLPIAFLLGVFVQATPRGVTKHWAQQKKQ